MERLLFRHLYGKEELYQLLFTYALVLILGDVAKLVWGTQQLSVSRPPGLTGSFDALRHHHPPLQPVHHGARPGASRSASGSCCSARGSGRIIRAAALDREMLGALGANVGGLYTGVFMIGSFLAGLGGALVTPIKPSCPAWTSRSSSRPSSSW